ncbi:hypothetical protein SLEP1_g11530 [Rubroshorea leprosula]|nr:hypothetical protein SLEP1_g11530 [Rubroshorea leprosula]
MDSDSGAIQEWMGIRERNKSRKRSRKFKSCVSVYKASKLILAAPRRNRRGRPRKELASKSSVPEFLANSNNGVADGSLNDSNIHNCNKSIMKKINAFGAKKIWEFAKSVRVVATGKEEEILRRLEQMEAQDKQHHRVNPSGKQRNGIEWEEGDFNVTRSQDERKGCRGVLTEMEDMKQWGLKRDISDHCPVLLKNEVKNWGPKPFRFFNTWLQHTDFKAEVAKLWKSIEVQGWGGYILKEKLKETKLFLKNWSKKNCGELDKKIENCKGMIVELNKKGETFTPQMMKWN